MKTQNGTNESIISNSLEKSDLIPLTMSSIIEPIALINILRNGSVEVSLKHDNTSKTPVHLELSKDGGLSWSDVRLNNNLLMGLEKGGNFLLRTRETKKIYPVSVSKQSEFLSSEDSSPGCMHKGRHRSIG